MQIKVYNDEGVARVPLKTLFFELSSWKYETISAKEIVHSPWEKSTTLLIIPGGRDTLYHTHLQGKGNNKIRSFVENGGSYLGICAGAYYGCQFVEFDKGMPLEVLGTRELSFFPGIARGPAYGAGTFFYDSEKGVRTAPLSLSGLNHFGADLQAYFNGGCYFVQADTFPNVKVLARYLDIPGEPAAIVECSIGKGRVILSGAHIEIGTTDPKTILRRKMKEQLKKHEPQRKQFFKKLLSSND